MGLFDDAFKKVFSDRRIFVEFINNFMPEDIGLRGKIKEEHLFLEDTIFKDPYFANREADILYKIQYKSNEIYIYLLVEHQFYVDQLMIFRILGYMVRIWEHYIDDYKKRRKKDKSLISVRSREFKLPPIIPIVFLMGVKNGQHHSLLRKKYKMQRILRDLSLHFPMSL